MIATNDVKLKQAIEQEQKAAQQLARRQRRLHALLAERQTANDPRMAELAAREKEVRNLLHRKRIHVGRRRFSIETQVAKLAKSREYLAQLETDESRLQDDLNAVLAARDQLIAELKQDLTGQVGRANGRMEEGVVTR